MLVLYFLIIVGAGHNIYRYVFKQQRYKSLHICYFYVLVVLIIFFRISWFSEILFRIKQNEKMSTFSALDKAIFYTDVIATYLEMLLVIQQVSSMYELYLMIWRSVMKIEAQNEDSEYGSFITDHSGKPYHSIISVKA